MEFKIIYRYAITVYCKKVRKYVNSIKFINKYLCLHHLDFLESLLLSEIILLLF